MSASREKKVRQERGADYVSPKQQKELEERKSTRRTTIIFFACVALFAAGVIAMLLYNSGAFLRSIPAARINGKSYSVSDMAYYYYNGRANILNSYEDLSSDQSLRQQDYTEGDEYATWYDLVADQSVKSLASIELAAQEAKKAGFTGGSDVDQMVKQTMDSLKANAANSGYDLGTYIKAIFGGMMTRSGFEKMLRKAALAETYIAAKSEPSLYSDAELQAVYDADPNSYSLVEYEAIIYTSSSFATEAVEATDTTEAVEADDGSAAALAAAKAALADYKAGKGLEAIASATNGTYSNNTTQYSTGSDILEWLYDGARKDGDADVLDYTFYGMSMGSVVVVFHSKERADFHTVNVRHILVDDEATANDLLAQYLAGDRTEASFAALVADNTTDTGSSENGGLYQHVYPGQMVKPFEDWCFEASRQPGDTGIVQSDYGYHVMYFVSHSDYSFWQELASSKLAKDWQTSLSDSITTELLDGMKYIDP